MPPCSRFSPRYMTNGSVPRNGSPISTASPSPAGRPERCRSSARRTPSHRRPPRGLVAVSGAMITPTSTIPARAIASSQSKKTSDSPTGASCFALVCADQTPPRPPTTRQNQPRCGPWRSGPRAAIVPGRRERFSKLRPDPLRRLLWIVARSSSSSPPLARVEVDSRRRGPCRGHGRLPRRSTASRRAGPSYSSAASTGASHQHHARGGAPLELRGSVQPTAARQRLAESRRVEPAGEVRSTARPSSPVVAQSPVRLLVEGAGAGLLRPTSGSSPEAVGARPHRPP